MSSPNIPANITIQDIYDAIRPTWDVDGDIKDAVAKEFKKVTELQEDNERLQEELEGKEVLAKAYKEHKIEIMKLKEELKEEVKRTRFVSGMAVKKLAESCKEAIDGDITEAEKQIKHLKQKNKELKEELKEEKEWEKETGREEAIEEYEKVAYEMCESRAHANDPILMARSAKYLNEENKKLKEEINGDGWLKQGYKTDLSNSHKQKNSMIKQIVKLKQENEKLKAENEELKEEKEELYDYEGAITCLGLIDGDEYNKVVAEKKELFKSLMKTKSIATELYREMKYALGYGEFDEPNRQNMYDHIKQLNERLMNERLMTPKEMSDKIDAVLS